MEMLRYCHRSHSLVFGGIVLGGYLYFKSRMTGTASSENAEETEKMLTQSASASVGDDGDLISGEYLLTSYDQNYPEYLTAIGIPSFVVNMFILASKEIIHVTKTGNHIKFTTKTDGDVVTREAEFTLGEMAEIPYGRKLEGIMHTMCDLKAPNHLFCTSTERTKGWTLTSEHIFSKAGVLNKRHHVSKDITTKKMYLRQGVVVNVEDQESMNLEGMVTVPPKVESDDPFSNSNDDEDSFFNDNEDSEDDFFNDDDDEDNTWG